MPSRPLILIVDDTLDNLKLLFGLLKSAYRVKVANNGEEALEIVAGNPKPDLILLDIMMPGMDGYSVCERLKTAPETRDIPVIFLTAKTQTEDETRGFAVGAADYVPKPINPAVLMARVKAQLALADQLRDQRAALHEANQHIARIASERDHSEINRQRIQDRQEALLAITRTALRDLGLDAYLAKTLRVIGDIPWLNVQPHGLLFLFNRRNELIQVAQHGLDAAQTARCAKARLGACSCGRTIAGTDTVFLTATEGDDPHCILGALDVGCYSLPLKEGEQVYGVLCIFTPADHRPVDGETDFMAAVAQTFTSLIRRRMAEETLRISQIETQMARNEVVRRLGIAAEFRDTETGMHVVRMSQYARAIAETMGCDAELCELIELAAPMHDVGKIGIHDNILRKPGKLTPEEFATMQEHTRIGGRILEGEDPLIRLAREIALTHHEKWSGSGYPEGLAGDAIPLTGRICAIADVFDALTMERPYKKAWPAERAIETIVAGSGSDFDPAAVDAFRRCIPRLLAIKARYRDETIDPRELLPSTGQAEDEHAWIPWSDAFSVGIQIIDEHHRYLLDWTNRIHTAIRTRSGTIEVAKAVFALEHYARIHFRAEERLIAAHDTSGLDAHRAQHRRFEAELAEWRSELLHNPFIPGLEMLEYLGDWLLAHIVKGDKEILAKARTASAERSCRGRQDRPA